MDIGKYFWAYVFLPDTQIWLGNSLTVHTQIIGLPVVLFKYISFDSMVILGVNKLEYLHRDYLTFSVF